jgi:hypothetical protein
MRLPNLQGQKNSNANGNFYQMHARFFTGAYWRKVQSTIRVSVLAYFTFHPGELIAEADADILRPFGILIMVYR